jgi:hypothetical protein
MESMHLIFVFPIIIISLTISIKDIIPALIPLIPFRREEALGEEESIIAPYLNL